MAKTENRKPKEKKEKKKEKKRKKRGKEGNENNRRKTSRSYSESLVKTLRVSIRRRNGAPKDKFQLKITH